MDSLLGSYSSEISVEQMRSIAPSIFAVEPYHAMSERYLFFPTSEIVGELRKNDFIPVQVMQSRSRVAGKQEYTKHMVKFQHRSMQEVTRERRRVGDVYPLIILTNAHDGTSAYKLDMGLFRLVCLNGMMVSSGEIDSIRCRHSGKAELIGEVIEASYRIIDQAPKVLDQVNTWAGKQLQPYQQEIFAGAASELRESTLHVEPRQLLAARRWDDGTPDRARSLWQTLNVVQENLIKGGMKGTSETGRRIRTREVKAIDADTRINKALWRLTEEMSKMLVGG